MRQMLLCDAYKIYTGLHVYTQLLMHFIGNWSYKIGNILNLEIHRD